MRLYLLLLTATLSFTFLPESKAQDATDSLWNIWNDTSLPDSTRFAANVELFWSTVYSNPDSAMAIARIPIDIGMATGDDKKLANFYNHIGVGYYILGKRDSAVLNLQRSLVCAERLGDDFVTAHMLSNLGFFQSEVGNYVVGLKHLQRSADIQLSLGDTVGAAETMLNVGTIYQSKEQFEEAYEWYAKALMWFEKYGADSRIPGVTLNMGIVEQHRGNYEAALSMFRFVLEMLANDENMDMRAYGVTLSNMGELLHKTEQMDSAMYYYQKCIDFRRENNLLIGIPSILVGIANWHIDQDNLSEAEIHAQEAYDLSVGTGATADLQGASFLLYKIAKKRGQTDRALEMYELYTQTTDSLESDEEDKAFLELGYKYEYEKKAAADSVRLSEEKKVIDAQVLAANEKSEREAIQRYFLIGGLVILTVFGIFIYNRLRVTTRQRHIIEEQKKQVEAQHDVIAEQKKEVEHKNKEVIDSITYAKRIQEAILPPQELIETKLPNSFFFYLPKDIVAGDFYWMRPLKEDNTLLFAAADCTGHGVPGAMVSVVCNNALNRSVREFDLKTPGAILDKSREIVMQEFRSSRTIEGNANQPSKIVVSDGMDIALCSLEQSPPNSSSQSILKYAGANNPLWIVRKENEAATEDPLQVHQKGYTLTEIKATKQPIGVSISNLAYETHTVELKAGDTFYIFSDGFVDQFGGERGKKYKSRAFKNFLLGIQEKSMREQQEALHNEFKNWKGNLEQIDDVCVIGVRV